MPKTRSMRFSDDEWESLQLEAQRRGYSGPNALLSAIARGELPIADKPAPPDLSVRVHVLEMKIEGLQDRLKGFAPTDLP